MPAEVVTSIRCAQYESTWEMPGSRPDVTYTVTWNGMGAHCTCPAFRYSRLPEDARSCKHINVVWSHGCFWNTQWYDGGTNELTPTQISTQVVAGQTCPNCGGPVSPVKIAV